jgi:hypothetical protein
VRFGWFVRNRWYPLEDADWKLETARDKKCIIQKDLLDPFENIPLEKFDKFQLQVQLDNLASTRSKDRDLQIKAYMQAIFAEAHDQEFLAKDPARSVKAPENLRDTDKTTLSWAQLRAALSKLTLKERLILELDTRPTASICWRPHIGARFVLGGKRKTLFGRFPFRAPKKGDVKPRLYRYLVGSRHRVKIWR